jgi:formamidopyrimidine-DNA glycosylase
VAEVPEVETVVRDLRATVTGRTIESAEVTVPETVRFTSPDEFAREIAGARILGAERRAKWALVALSGDRTLAIHFMLFGYLRLEPPTATREPTLCLLLHLDGQEDLRLLDRVAYTRVALLPNDDINVRLGLDTLGPEVLDESFGPDQLEARLRPKRVPIKPTLLDQHVVAGMGNRDADESLWRARIDPRRPARELTDEEAAQLTSAMREVLAEGISRRGTLVDLWGKRGTQLQHRQIFEREGQPCPRCGTPIARLRQNNRNTYYCPHCQQ